MQAVIDINGKQYQIEEGRYVTVDRLPHAENEVFEIGNVLMVVDGTDSLLGAPTVEGAKVTAKVLSHGRGPKLLVYKMRCKKGYRRKNGHRQDFTKLQIEEVVFPGKKASAKKTAEPAADKPAKKPAAKAEQPAGDKPAKKAAGEPKPKAAAKKPAAKKADKPAEGSEA